MPRQKVFQLGLFAACLAAFAASCGWSVWGPSSVARAENVQQDDPAPRAVDPSMHEFMEYVFEPAYKRLKVDMAKKPADRRGWKGIKGDAMTLAEGGNLLLHRLPEKTNAANTKNADWTKYSVQVRKHGGDLYRAAKKMDYETATASYKTMLTSCNACHTQFADGKHQLKP